MMKVLSAACALTIAVTALIVSAAPVGADNNRLELANQSNWSGNTGFYLDLENATYAYGSTQPLSALTLYLGVANGSSWRFLSARPTWLYNHAYRVHCTISSTSAAMTLDGQSVAASDGSVSVDSADGFFANQVPLWACADTDYWICQDSIRIQSGAAVLVNKTFPSPNTEITKYMFTPQQQLSEGPLAFKPGKTITIDAVFTLVQKLSYAPIVDQFGQSRYGDWTTKIHSTDQLVAGAKSEDTILEGMPSPQGRDAYGGAENAGWSLPATGFFTTANHNGFWWLISPAGNPCFYTGVDDAIGFGGDMATPITGRTQLFGALPSSTGKFAAAYTATPWGDTGTTYYSFIIANAIKKYGSNWLTHSQKLLQERLQKWGFTGIGKWSNSPGGLPFITNLYYWAPTYYDTKPDIFDPAIVTDVQNSLAGQVQNEEHDPYLVGWAVGNEEPDCVAYGTVAAVLQLTTATPGKQALVNYALQQFYGGNVGAMATGWGVTATSTANLYSQALSAPSAQQEPLREYFEDNYFRTMYRIVKGLDPNHLYFGDWQVPNWNYSPNDWTIDAAHCDVVGYDLYSTNFSDANLPALAQQSGKPVLCGEFGYPPTYDGLEGLGQYFNSANYDADAGADYMDWIDAATQNPNCIGGCWFMYRDEMMTGRGPGSSLALVQSENYAFGVADVADQPKWDMVNQMTAVNMTATQLRLNANAAATIKPKTTN